MTKSDPSLRLIGVFLAHLVVFFLIGVGLLKLVPVLAPASASPLGIAGLLHVLLVFLFATTSAWIVRRMSAASLDTSEKENSAIASLGLNGLVALVGVAGLIFYVTAVRWTPYPYQPHEDSTRFGVVSQVLLGAVPHRDVLINFGILSDVVRPLIAFKLWGISYASDQTARGLLSAVCAVLLFGLTGGVVRSRRILFGCGALLVLRPMLFIPDRVLPVLVAALFYTLASGRRRPAFLFLSAAFFALSCLYSIDVGVTTLIGIALFVVVQWSLGHSPFAGERAMLVSGAASIIATYFVYLVMSSGLLAYAHDGWQTLAYRLPIWEAPHLTGVFELWWLHDRQAGYFFMTRVFPLFVSGFVLINSAARARPTARSIELFLACLLLGHYLMFLGRPDRFHWDNATALLFPLSAWVVDYSWPRWPARWSIRSGALLAVNVFVAGVALYPLLGPGYARKAFQFSELESLFHFHPPPPTSVERLGALRVDSSTQDHLGRVISAIQRHVPPSGYYFDMTPESPHYFFANRRNPTRFPLTELVSGPLMTAACIKQLETHPPDAVLVIWREGKIFTRPHLKSIKEFIEARYQFAEDLGPYALLTRRALNSQSPDED